MRDWTRTNRNWFAAVQVEKRLMFIILTLIVAVAAFNLVSTLVMTVTDKRADIAILRTLGASPRSVMGIFMVQGAAVGVIGTLGGAAARPGHRLQHRRHRAGDRARCCNVSFLPEQHLPDQPHAERSAAAATSCRSPLISLVLAFVATLYPSWRASRVNPAEALRYE